MAFTDRIYEVDWSKVVSYLVPAPIRWPKLFALLNALVSPVTDLYSRFIVYKNYTVYWLGINSQVCFMKKALNDKYDVSLRRITIIDGVQFPPVVLYRKDENKPVVLYKKSEGQHVVLYTKGETAQFTVDFVVLVPTGISFTREEMSAFIDTIKTPSKTYQIKRV